MTALSNNNNNSSASLQNHHADLGLVLGSGLASVIDAFDVHTTIPYADIPGLLACSVSGHKGQLALGTYNDLNIACFQGRFHWYEGAEGNSFIAMMECLKTLGCSRVLLTNAAGSLTETMPVGTVALIRDHLNLQGKTPLDGIKPVPFIGMEDAYSTHWINTIQSLAQGENIEVPTGVYAGVQGPQFETPAEISMIRTLGADLVGMSTVPETIAARYMALEVAALSMVTNMAAGMRQQTLSHDVTLAGAKKGEQQMISLIHMICRQLIEQRHANT